MKIFSITLIAAFLVNERRVAHPMLPLEFFARRSFSVLIETRSGRRSGIWGWMSFAG